MSNSRYRVNEAWIQNKMVSMDALEAFMPEVNASLEEKGYKHTDLKRVAARVKTLRSMSKAWQYVAKQQEKMAIEAEEKGHLVTAGVFYHRAALYFGKAQLYYHVDDEKKKLMHSDVVRCYEKAMPNFDTKIERIVIPFGEHNLYGVVHKPENCNQKLPAVLLVPGMDMVKEDYPNPNDNQFIKRGMIVVSMDGPGQGETRVHGCKVTLDNYQEAGKAFLDYMTSMPEVDADKIGILGISMGSYNGPLIAAYDDRVKACVAMLGCYLDKERQFNYCQPGFRSNYKFMTGIYDEDEFDLMAKETTLANVADKIRIPMLLACGEYDELCPPEQVKEFYNMLDCPKEMWIMEDQYHPCGGVAAELYPWALDWLKDMLVKGCPSDYNKEKFVSAW